MSSAGPETPASPASFVVRGGRVFDGSGGPGVVRDLVVRDGVVAVPSVDALLAAEALPVVDATGLDVLPGFVDVHSHDDAALFREGGLAPKTGQGVTTVVIGNCGLGLAPSDRRLVETAGPVLGPFPSDGWRSFAAYLEGVAAAARAVNVAALVPHAPLRTAVMGVERRPASPSEVDRIAGSASDALDAGAVGVSLGLMYSPGDSAERPELLALASAAARRGRLLVAHLRNEADHLRASVDELADLARASGAAIHVSHLKVTGPRNAGTMPAIVDHLDSLRAEGVDVTCDVYPYDAGSTTVVSLFPPASLAGGPAALVALLADASTRASLLATLERPWNGTSLENQWAAVGPGRILLAGFPDPALSPYEGLSVADIAALRGQEPLEALADLVVATGASLTVVVFHTDPRGMEAALAWPHTLVGSDGLPREQGFVHPRLYGTFSRVLASGLLPRDEAIRRMTQDAGARFGLAGRGSLAVGSAADLQLVDPAAYADRATYAEPRLSPAGLVDVRVNGVPVSVAPAGAFVPARV